MVFFPRAVPFSVYNIPQTSVSAHLVNIFRYDFTCDKIILQKTSL